MGEGRKGEDRREGPKDWKLQQNQMTEERGEREKPRSDENSGVETQELPQFQETVRPRGVAMGPGFWRGERSKDPRKECSVRVFSFHMDSEEGPMVTGDSVC